MIAFKQGHLPSYLKAFVKEEKLQKNPGFIMKNLKYLLEFWKTHYLKRGKDCSALEQVNDDLNSSDDIDDGG